MFSGPRIAAALTDLGITHVVWLPDSGMGHWEESFEQSGTFKLVRVTREGEAWAIAAGLHLGGARPLVVIQTTGLFESGDAMRNALFDLRLPLFALIGHRSYLVENSNDTARHFAEPILQAWGLDYLLIVRSQELEKVVSHYRACQAAGKPGVALIAEGRM